MTVRVDPRALVVFVSDTALAPLGLAFDAHGAADLRPFNAQLHELKALCPEQQAVTLTIGDDVRHALFVQVVDTCVGADFTRVMLGAGP